MTQSLRSVAGGLVASVLSLAYCFSYGALIFAGPLQPFLTYGIAAALITTVITATAVALTSSFRFAVAGPDSNTAALLAITAEPRPRSRSPRPLRRTGRRQGSATA